MLKLFINILYWTRALKALRADNYLRAFESLGKIRTKNNTLKVKILLFQSYASLFMLKNNLSIKLLYIALEILSNPTNFKKLSVYEIQYLEQYAYDILKNNYILMKEGSKIEDINKKIKKLPFDISNEENVRKSISDNFPIQKRS